MAYAISNVHPNIEYIEVVASISSRSAGPGTRANIDEFTQTTKDALLHFTGVPKAKTIIILNPAEPPILMRNTIYAIIPDPDMDALRLAVQQMEKRIQCYVPGYQVILEPVLENGRVTTMVQVTGLGDYLPPYSGNLDIITCAAVHVAEMFARKKRETSHE
jgi:acetaldehyde dehydrogenase